MHHNLSYDADVRFCHFCYSLFSARRFFIGIASLLMIQILFKALILFMAMSAYNCVLFAITRVWQYFYSHFMSPEIFLVNQITRFFDQQYFKNLKMDYVNFCIEIDTQACPDFCLSNYLIDHGGNIYKQNQLSEITVMWQSVFPTKK